MARAAAVPAVSAHALTTLALAALLVAVALHGGGGLQLGARTAIEVGADLLAGALGAAAVLAGGATRRPWGLVALACFALLAAVTALSVLWALDPAEAWREANRTVAWLAVFGAGVALVRLAPQRWDSLVAATVLAATAISVIAIATKVFPGTLAPDETYARLREPFGYWNAVGLAAVLGAPGALWLAARRHGHGAVSALAFPALGLMLTACLLSYSRGALVALAAGLVAWFVLVPLRLRGAAVLITASVGAALVALWTFAQPALSEDRAVLVARSAAGRELGVLLTAMLLALLLAGLAVGFAAARRAPAPRTRRGAGLVLAVALALVPVTGLTALALSDKGLGRSIAEGWRGLTDPTAAQPTNDPGRLTAVGSVRARYFDEALRMFADEPVLGLGAGGYAIARPRYRRDDLEVRHAHGYAVQTLADLGLVGATVSLALLAAWLAAAWRATGGRRALQTPERMGIATLVAVVVAFAAHSFVDWTWFVPGTAVVALLCAGWVAARGPLDEPPVAPAGRGLAERVRANASPARWAAATAIAALAVAAAWTAWQPARAQATADDALVLLEQRKVDDARATARRAARIDPLSVDPLFALAAIERSAGRLPAARAALEDAVARQPAEVDTWLSLAQLELGPGGDAQRARRAISAALYLDPRNDTASALELQAVREAAQPGG